ncbi:MAG: MATE family efflux transporter [Gammaproteobacteria bacterium]|jgi:MATE family multidrug resistance protein
MSETESNRTRLRDAGAHRRLWQLAAPMMLSNVSIAVLGLVDTAVIGHLSDPSYLAGIALATVLFDFLYWGVTFLRMGTTGVTAQVHGGGDTDGLRTTLRDALTVALALALAMLIWRDEIRGFGLSVLQGSDTSSAHAARYYTIKIWGAPGVLATMVFIGWLIGVQNARAAMALAALPCLLHAGLDVLLVVGLDLGIEGAAYAALTTAYCSALLGVALVWRELGRRGARRGRLPWRIKGLRKLLSLNGNILLRTLCLIATFACFTKQGAIQGDTILAANAILLNFQMLTALALDGFANALEALVGGAIGARDRRAFVESIVVGGAWSGVFAILFTLAYASMGQSLINALTNLEDVRAAASRYLVWAAVAPLISVWCFVFDGIFIGGTRGSEMRNSMLIASLGVFVPSLIVLQTFGNHGLWVAFMLFFAARGLSMGWYFLRIDRRGGFVPA